MMYADLIGVPFLNKGRDVKKGLDCYGLVKEVYKRHGINIPEYDDQYKNYTDMCQISEIIKGNTKGYPWKEIKELRPEILPTSDSNTFYRRRREFFNMLNKVTDI